MKVRKTTLWFPPEVKPVHQGIYQRDYDLSVVYCKWEDGAFHTFGYSPEEAAKSKVRSSNTDAPWRGLAYKP